MQSAESMSCNIYERSSRAFGSAIGTIILSLFGLIWILLGLASLDRLHAGLAILFSCLVVVLLVLSISTIRRTRVLARDKTNAARNKHINRMCGLVNAVQWTAIFIAVQLLTHFHRTNWIVSAITLIVGAHFLPLAHLFKGRLYYFSGWVLMIWAVAAVFIFPAQSMDALAALGTGGILWLTAARLTLDSARFTPGLSEIS